MDPAWFTYYAIVQFICNLALAYEIEKLKDRLK